MARRSLLGHDRRLREGYLLYTKTQTFVSYDPKDQTSAPPCKGGQGKDSKRREQLMMMPTRLRALVILQVIVFATSVAQPAASAAPERLAQAATRLAPLGGRSADRKPSPPLASLPAPRAAGPLRILLIDDDASANNPGGDRGASSRSDKVFRDLVTQAVGGRADAWSAELVSARADGPALERLRDFNVVIWYTGAAYGANNDTIGREDEKVLRRYLEETGGAVILVSPGYVNNLVYGQSWDAADHPFLREVLAVNGVYGLAQRATRGTVKSQAGSTFAVEPQGGVETQFSVVNPDGAAIVFTSPVSTSYVKQEGDLPVAVASAYGSGRIVYAGFTFENIPEKEQAKAFSELLGAATGGTAAAPAPAAVPAQVPRTLPPGRGMVRESATPQRLLNTEIQLSVSASATPTSVALTWSSVQGTPTTAKVERVASDGSAVQLFDPNMTTTRATDRGPFPAGAPVRYRVTATLPDGRVATSETSVTVPQPTNPTDARVAVDRARRATLSWSAVPNAVAYQVVGTGVTGVVTVRGTTWTSAPLPPGSAGWSVASVYEPGGALVPLPASPMVTTRVQPTPGAPFLSLLPQRAQPVPVGNDYYSTCFWLVAPLSAGSCPARAQQVLRTASDWNTSFYPPLGTPKSQFRPTRPTWPMAAFTDLSDLGRARRVNCAELVAFRSPGKTICWATSHGDVAAQGIVSEPERNLRNAAAADDIRSLSVIVRTSDSVGDFAFFGVYRSDRPIPFVANFATQDFTKEEEYSVEAFQKLGAQLDSQGEKPVPFACMSCHGGRYDPVSKLVIGGKLLPLDPAGFLLQNRATSEEAIRRINEFVLDANPTPAIRSFITALYGGAPKQAGRVAADTAVPPGWAGQADLFRKVVRPYCASCHFAQSGPLSFETSADFLSKRQEIYASVCSTFTMPHSEVGLRRFWEDGVRDGIPALLASALGYARCPM
jgi:hypothetical protein